MKKTYEITYHKQSKKWVVWLNSEGERSTNCKALFRGTKNECKAKLKELNGKRSI